MAKNEFTMASNTHNVLAVGTLIKGNICAEEDFRIDGTIEGNITCKGKIIIGTQSSITGNIECTNIDMMGKVIGNVTCTNTIILRASANINGEIKSQTIEIEPGAVFSGTCSMITE